MNTNERPRKTILLNVVIDESEDEEALFHQLLVYNNVPEVYSYQVSEVSDLDLETSFCRDCLKEARRLTR